MDGEMPTEHTPMRRQYLRIKERRLRRLQVALEKLLAFSRAGEKAS